MINYKQQTTGDCAVNYAICQGKSWRKILEPSQRTSGVNHKKFTGNLVTHLGSAETSSLPLLPPVPSDGSGADPSLSLWLFIPAVVVDQWYYQACTHLFIVDKSPTHEASGVASDKPGISCDLSSDCVALIQNFDAMLSVASLRMLKPTNAGCNLAMWKNNYDTAISQPFKVLNRKTALYLVDY